MRRLHELDPQRPQLEQYVRTTAQRMGESAIVMTIFTKDYAKAIDALLQFSVAIMLDKPIFLLAPEGQDIPQKVRAIAEGIEFYKDGDTKSMEAATTRLMAMATSKGFTA